MGGAHEQPLHPTAHEFPHDRSPERVLRVGYVSGDFRHHPVGRFIAPVLAHHDRTQSRFTVIATSGNPTLGQPDCDPLPTCGGTPGAWTVQPSRS